MINYILQVVLFQVLFLAVYDFFLSKETFFTKNRWYLLSTPIVSFILPLIKIPTFQNAIPQEYIVYLPEIFLSPENAIQKAVLPATFYESVNYVSILFWLGVFIFSVLFFIKLIKIIHQINKYEVIKQADFTLVLIPNQTKAFSFFNYIFIGKEIPKTEQSKIILHELVHSKQKHSLDLLFFEILKIVMWFNPIIFLYQKRITLVHEYISDEIVAKSEDKKQYINSLLSSFFQVENIAFVNQFYKQTLIKKRIMMMTKNKSKKMNQLKYLVLIPMLVSMLFYTSCTEDAMKQDVTMSKKEIQKLYFSNNLGDLKLIESNGSDKFTHFDILIGFKKPKDFKEISLNDLSKEERNEFNTLYRKSKERGSDRAIEDYAFYQMKSGRKVLATIMNPNSIKKENSTSEITEKEEISFMVIDKAPTFPGCEAGDKRCFSEMVQKHFSKNFNADLPKTLGLSSGRKRVFISFKIDKEGNVVDVKSRAPHPEIEEEVARVMKNLPKMIPGEHENNKITVKYSIPFTIVIE